MAAIDTTTNTAPATGTNQTAQTQQQPTSSAPAWTTDPQYAGMDPALQQIYINSGQTPEGKGTGFADWQYWQNTAGPSQYARLTNDINGTGTDQATGTPWQSGAWSNSGGGANGGGGSFSFSSTPMPPASLSSLMSQVQPWQSTASDQSLLGQLQGIANQSQVVDPNDPVIKSQMDAAASQQNNAVKSAVAASAERGGAYGNPDATARSANEQAGQNLSGLQASLMQNELNARRTQIQNALSEQGSMLTAEDQMALQSQLGQLNAALGNQSLANQYSLGVGQLGLGQQQINSNNDQFAANYGLNAGNQANYWNALNSGLLG